MKTIFCSSIFFFFFGTEGENQNCNVGELIKPKHNSSSKYDLLFETKEKPELII